ncbi:mas-related G-protein coupled receptor member X4-like [Gracilinanus agilis]|uniref:mas-related G-protein coupled receptor member X4-like n=1 Tax=Gracilinanus agilis TaxID=191870 RepID=UPI001CFEBD18|nr:mas-related G-protein coupled receptor member X4-like [Gracilinanus agilis]
MAVSPTPEQQDFVPDITVQRRTNSSLDPVAETSRFPLFYFIMILSLVVALVGLVGNSIVLWLLGFRIQRSPFSVYILNLAGSDTLFLGSCFVLCIWEIVGDFKVLDPDLLWSCILYMPYCVGLSLLASISTERCLSVLFPIWYRCHRPKHTSGAVCAVLWALPSLFSGALVALRFHSIDRVYVSHLSLRFLQMGWFALLSCVLCVSNLTLVLSVQSISQRRQPPRLYLLILLAVLVFLLCCLPLGIIKAIEFFSGFSLMPYGLPWLLSCVNSSANPFIYFFLGSQWRRRGREPLRVVLQRALEEERVEGDGGRDTSHANTLDKLS